MFRQIKYRQPYVFSSLCDLRLGPEAISHFPLDAGDADSILLWCFSPGSKRNALTIKRSGKIEILEL